MSIYSSSRLLCFAIVLAAAGCRPVDEIQAPALRLDQVEVRALSGGEADLTVAVGVVNPNDFEVSLVEVAGRLILDGIDLAELAWEGDLDCKGHDAVRLRIPVHMSVGEHGDLLGALLDGRPLEAALNGEVTFARGVVRRTFPVPGSEASLGGESPSTR